MNSFTDLLSSPNDFFINLGNRAFFGEHAYIKDIRINYSFPPVPVDVHSWDNPYLECIFPKSQGAEIQITAIAPDISLIFVNAGKISTKMVKDCTIDELVFAIREKIKRGE
jgi:hypothetical protein